MALTLLSASRQVFQELAERHISGASLRSPLKLLSAEKAHEKITSQYERHERQHKQWPIRIAEYFGRGFATHDEEAKDTIAPRPHGSSIRVDPRQSRKCQGGFSLRDDILSNGAKERRLA